jgi:hypothetical protein
MLEQHVDTTSLVRDQAIAPVECDVPDGWSLEDWRSVRGLAREVVDAPAAPWWRRRPRVRHN